MNLYNLSIEELSEFLAPFQVPAFRTRQIYRQLYVNRVRDVEAMSDLPAALRRDLSEKASIGAMKLLDVRVGDGGLTHKALFELRENVVIETVLMVYPGRATVCVSSQAGCPMGCTFCATAKLGFLHDLSAGDMIQQVVWAAGELPAMRELLDEAAARRHKVNAKNFPQALTNVVFMGMGEPFNNYTNWWSAVNRLHDPDGFNMGARSFTVSTVGLVPGIEKLMDEPLPVNLAISLHAASDEARSAMMPVNRRYPIHELMQAVKRYTEKTRRRVSFEYILIQEQNDSQEEARALAEVIQAEQVRLCHVNLIPWNPVPGTAMERSHRDRVNRFRDALQEAGVTCTIRIQRGVDIDAACGQLAGSQVAG